MITESKERRLREFNWPNLPDVDDYTPKKVMIPFDDEQLEWLEKAHAMISAQMVLLSGTVGKTLDNDHLIARHGLYSIAKEIMRFIKQKKLEMVSLQSA